jgi:hypothetical protein
MRKILILVLAAFCFASPVAYAAHNFQTGKLIDVTTDERSKKGTSVVNAIFTVQVGDIVYTLKGEKVAPKAKDYAKGLIVGDPIQASVEGENVILQKPGGKELKTSILKRERANAK